MGRKAGSPSSHAIAPMENGMKEKVHVVFASLLTDRAYRHDRGFEQEKIQPRDTCQKMVRSKTGCAGVMVSLDTESGFRDVVLETSAYGLGKTVTQGDPPTVCCTEDCTSYIFKGEPKLGKNVQSLGELPE